MPEKAAKYLCTKEVHLVSFVKRIQLGFLLFLFGIHLLWYYWPLTAYDLGHTLVDESIATFK